MIRLWLYLLRRYEQAVLRQAEKLRPEKSELEMWQHFALNEVRTMHATLIAWRLSMDQPEVDIHESVDAMIEEYKDQLARLTEQIVP